MYLTRLLLDTRSAQVRRDLGNPYELHRTLVRAFVQSDAQDVPRFLWRVEPQAAWNSPPVVLVQSEHSADWSLLQALPRYLKAPPASKALSPERLFPAGQRCRFRLFANPTVTRAGKRIGLVGDDAQLAWLQRQGQSHGFALEAAIVTHSEVLKPRKQAAVLSLQRACYEGVLQVTDADRLKAALVAGIGPGKAFGCGLLSLARI
ncbi:type I-E CRISPR-associated protein Cas6/Cse3/CasE [Lysobacteraceae bacterium NML75-0749]|uniref:Type I-E CRISPR-associated protein Cas6/Cse3/CasE n=1 Tax=Vandammella animalimorsus TaxID=2029117 RepID=A0A2A2B1P3_9BURK|nr:type I-E CRISPR-associated protein Cas6/Cse3/CasE [Vandammella animalimorsus]PJK02346.1 type I-E CRISPR-associated protein Cas6/Cse3/CasE [Xanthomonadaceae bacterium NML91-0268]PJK03626.1 type I-E CRISPR-associated protein Cas6/Cse3/CasE [Xanthomonadaceae bacterium NML75-0749]PJK03980.1 type I-E CRISPR-associated protein Cas6/Cse3/CasE [Xanthomonadaceae bacterium NML71-0210]RRD42915.1 type I-E CRISPR-associated protein Cas6/Cse3/CasE [Comamonadaceae bacterium OH3737_COT-264]RRD66741.1 type 